jgi:DNA polymerase I
MQIEIRNGVSLHPGTFSAVVAPEKEMVSAINRNADLRRFLFLYIGGNYSRILARVSRQSANFEIRRAFTAHQILTILRESAHTVVFVEHDPTLFDGAATLLEPVAMALKEVARESLVILYTPAADRTFLALAKRADHFIEIVTVDERRESFPASRILSQSGRGSSGQRTLEVS